MEQFRVALVCYGGVSLAVYMHGVTKELQKLVRATRRWGNPDLETPFPKDNPFPADQTEHVYFELIRELSPEDHFAVVIDIIAGTSAGGINGLVLAKALAHDLSQDGLLKVWLEDADIKKLTRGPRWLPLWLKLPFISTTGILKKAGRAAPLKGDYMLELVYDVLAGMDRSNSSENTLLPKGHSIDLYVTTTDMRGIILRLPLDDPDHHASARDVNDREHAHLLHFHCDENDLEDSDFRNNVALTFAARATSSFPGAFPAATIDDVERILERKDRPWSPQDRTEFETKFFPVHRLSKWSSAREAFFIDGGVLNNKPFEPVVDAIASKPAGMRVRRRLLYLEPHPVEFADTRKKSQARYFETVVAGAYGVAAHEPIIQDLRALQARNERVGRLNDLIAETEPNVRKFVEGVTSSKELLNAETDAEKIATWRGQIHSALRERAGASYDSYNRIKISLVVEHFGRVIGELFHYPALSDHATFVREVVRKWANHKGLLHIGETGLTDEQLEFLRTLDLGFRIRRLRSLIKRLDYWYEERKHRRVEKPVGSDLDQFKRGMYDLVDQVDRAMTKPVLGDALFGQLKALFDEDAITKQLDVANAELQSRAQAYAKAHGATLDDIERQLRELAQGLRNKLDDTIGSWFLRMRQQEWEPRVREDLLMRYLGFPYWDLLVYPIQALTEIGELNEVRVVRLSPDDSQFLKWGGAEQKLEGIKLSHFGAFFNRKSRENDYLWGRLDAADRLISVLADVAGGSGIDLTQYKARALQLILDEETKRLTHISGRIEAIRYKLEQSKKGADRKRDTSDH